MSIEMEGFCRGCLLRYDETTDLLQYTEKNRRLFLYSTGLQVKRNDAFTFQLCKDCYINMKVSSKFKKQCRTSEKRFKSYLALKQTGKKLDFCTFLKNDDTWSLRLPMPSGNSTPAYQKGREDDNDSTCTSIRNFMTDILKAEDIPDTEARIIREVIEEEADVLDDSLDSHWLQDDVSLDTDFRMDFSFSLFSTPKSVANDHCYTPREDDIQFLEPSINTQSKHVYVPRKSNIDLISEENDENQDTCESNEYINGIKYETEHENQVKHPNAQQANEIDWVVENVIEDHEIVTNVVDNDFIEKIQDYTIDRNIENALADTSNKEISLDDLLKTPPVHHAPSPSITNILFGDKLDSCSTPKTTQWQENYDNVQGDMNILEEFLHCDNEQNIDDPKPEELSNNNNRSGHIQIEILREELKDKDADNQQGTDEGNQLTDDTVQVKTKQKRVPLAAIEKDVDIDNCYCKLCEKKFNHIKGLKLHFAKTHNTLVKLNRFKKRVCDLCGEEKHMSSSNFKRHRELHFDNLIVECEICKMKLTGLVRLRNHNNKYHRPETDVPREQETKYVCALCGKKFYKKAAYIDHYQRHFGMKDYTCGTCDKKFVTQNDLKKHELVHNAVRQFKCSCCPWRFARRDALTRHLRTHKDDKYECVMCGKRFDDKYKLRVHINKKCPMLRPKKSQTLKWLEKKKLLTNRNKEPSTDPIQIEQ